MARTQFEKDCDDAVDSHDCKTEKGEGRWMATGDGRRTIKDRSEED